MGSKKDDGLRNVSIQIIRVLVLLVFFLLVISTFYMMCVPLLPTSDEYIGRFPDDLGENIEEWTTKTFWRHLILFHEYFTVEWFLLMLGNVFFLLLILNVSKVLKNYGSLDAEGLINKYFNWAVSSLLIAIVLMTSTIEEENLTQISLGIIGLTISIFILLFYAAKIENRNKD